MEFFVKRILPLNKDVVSAPGRNNVDNLTTEYTELQPLLSGVHSVMRVKLPWLVRVGRARPPPLVTFTITSKVAVYPLQLSGQTTEYTE